MDRRRWRSQVASNGPKIFNANPPPCSMLHAPNQAVFRFVSLSARRCAAQGTADINFLLRP